MIENPSQHQLDIFNTLLNTDKNIVVRASAGSGKTSTIVTAAKLLSPSLTSCFLAFNKSIVEELKSRLPQNTVCKTAHSFGMTALIEHYRVNFKVSEYKNIRFIEEKLKTKTKLKEKERNALKFAFFDAINLIRMYLLPYEKKAIDQLCCKYSIILTEEELQDCIDILQRIDYYNKSFSKTKNLIDFVDMIHLPVTNPKIRLPQFDYLFVDELQDLNDAQQYLVERMLAPRTGRLIGVGDPFQSIYSFGGASGQSFEYFESKPNTVSLPLSISYRCGKKIVEEARTIYPDIQFYEKNEDGEVREGNATEINTNDMVICRNNRPLIQLYFNLLEAGKPAVIIGRDIEVGLNKVLSKVIDYNIREGVDRLYDQLAQMKADLRSKGVKTPSNNPKVINFYEQIRTIEAISTHCDYMYQISDRIKEIFNENKKDAIKLMTIHKSKGLEADRVFLIESFEGKKLIPSPYANQQWELVQENNVNYVAHTRAKKALIKVKL